MLGASVGGRLGMVSGGSGTGGWGQHPWVSVAVRMRTVAVMGV